VYTGVSPGDREDAEKDTAAAGVGVVAGASLTGGLFVGVTGGYNGFLLQ